MGLSLILAVVLQSHYLFIADLDYTAVLGLTFRSEVDLYHSVEAISTLIMASYRSLEGGQVYLLHAHALGTPTYL